MTIQNLDEYFIWSDRMNYTLCNFINEYRLDYRKTIGFLKNKNIFKYKNSDELIIELKNECLNAKSIQEQEEELKQFLNEEKLC